MRNQQEAFCIRAENENERQTEDNKEAESSRDRVYMPVMGVGGQSICGGQNRVPCRESGGKSRRYDDCAGRATQRGRSGRF